MRRQLAGVVVLAVCVLAGTAACSKEAGPRPALDAFLALWSQGKIDGVAVQSPDGTQLAAPDVLTQLKKLAGDLPPAGAKFTVVEPVVTDKTATAAVTVDWTVLQGVVWNYETTVRMAKDGDTWRVIWTPATLQPKLELPDDTMKMYTVPAPRGRILDGAGGGIVTDRLVVDVGVVPNLIKDQAKLIAALDKAFKRVGVTLDFSDLPGRIAAAKPTEFVQVVTLRREVYQQIRDQIHELDGTVFNEHTQQLAPSRTFARALIGAVGDVTREDLDKNPGKFAVGDQVGQSGLERTYDVTLRGADGVRVALLHSKDAAAATNESDLTLFKAEAKSGVPVKTTLDQNIQNAADAALASQPLRAAVVAVRISDGGIVAVANGPAGAELNLGFTASVPPGSTFKMISALALLDKGAVNLDTPVACPKTLAVEGRTFKNSGDFELGTVPFRTDFAKSCNTAFAALAAQLKPDLLRKAAATVGVGTVWNLGVEANTGTVPANVSDVENAAAAFGQGQTLVSPVVLAGAAAALARGSWIQPTLFAELPAGAPKAPDGTPSPAKGTALNAASVAALKTMMREVVTTGTGTGLLNLPGGDVFAKTGTAEYDNNPANTHAWTIGWRGDIAFAVFVEKGGSSATTAVPIAAAFLRGF